MKLMSQRTDSASVLDETVRLEGELRFSGTLRIDGALTGSVVTPGQLTIGPKARIEGTVRAGHVELFGTVAGDVTADESVEISRGGVLIGDVSTPRLVIEEGGRFEGRSCRPSEATAAAEAEAVDESTLEVQTD